MMAPYTCRQNEPAAASGDCHPSMVPAMAGSKKHGACFIQGARQKRLAAVNGCCRAVMFSAMAGSKRRSASFMAGRRAEVVGGGERLVACSRISGDGGKEKA